MNIFLDDSLCRENLFPFTQTRHTADIRIGILTIREKWELLTRANIITGEKPLKVDFTVPANVIPTLDNFEQLLAAGTGIPVNEYVKAISYPWEVFLHNDWALKADYRLITINKKSRLLSTTSSCNDVNKLFIGEGAVAEHCIINTENGPVYIGDNALIMEGCLIRGPVAICESATVKMGSRIYGATTIGPSCLAGGEIKNSVLFGYSNKAHDGYLGDSVIGEWCNIGAGTTNSNLKNNAGPVKYFLSKTGEPITAGNKAGLIMGDYSRCAINTSFNTGTVVGISCNIFGPDMPPKYLDNFSWGQQRYDLDKAIVDIEAWKKMKGYTMDENEKTILRDLYTNK